MSHISVQGEQSTTTEILALANLTALAASGAGQFIRKTGATTFENATPAGGTLTTEAPTGTVDDSNMDFVFTEEPYLISINHMVYRKNSGWTWSGSTATLSFPVGSGGDIFGIMQ